MNPLAVYAIANTEGGWVYPWGTLSEERLL